MDTEARESLWVDLARHLAARSGYLALRILGRDSQYPGELRVYLRSLELDATRGHYVYITAIGGVGATCEIPVKVVAAIEANFGLALVTDRPSETMAGGELAPSRRLH